MKNIFTTRVVGVTKENQDGTDRQKLIKNYVKEHCDSNKFDKDNMSYMSNEDIKLDGYKQWQYDLFEENTVNLVPEPDNPYDENAIKVIHNKIGHIGYIPKESNQDLMNFLKEHNNQVTINMNLEGGPYKYYNEYQDKVISKSAPFYFKLVLKSLNVDEKSKDEKSKDDKDLDKKKNKPINPTRYLIFAAISLILAIAYIVERYIPLTLIFLYLLYRNIRKYRELKNDTKSSTISNNNNNNNK
ncbi:HIRAN domain-containing protein [Anaerococcus lactolyticus]|uniref:HIRAN domain-containing protein n=1 Tax=Anaerococcus lactolyticus TaxID=33032 RepID=UPI0023F27532|nr:HIRAN domain-containing protein [Anaerococcus lactolyticus]